MEMALLLCDQIRRAFYLREKRTEMLSEAIRSITSSSVMVRTQTTLVRPIRA